MATPASLPRCGVPLPNSCSRGSGPVRGVFGRTLGAGTGTPGRSCVISLRWAGPLCYRIETSFQNGRLSTVDPRPVVGPIGAIADAPGDGSNPGALPPPVPLGVPLSGWPGTALSGRFPGVCGADLLTGLGRRRQEIALRGPFLSPPPDLADLVRTSGTPVRGRFQRGRHLPRFEPHLPENRTSSANQYVRWCPMQSMGPKLIGHYGGSVPRPTGWSPPVWRASPLRTQPPHPRRSSPGTRAV